MNIMKIGMSDDQMNEIERFRKSVSLIQKIGVKKVLLTTIAYIWSLFLLCIAVIAVSGWLTNANIYNTGFLVFSAVAFAAITGIDLYLLYNGKYSFVLLVWLVPISIILTFKAVSEKMERMPLDLITLPVRVRKYIFLMNSLQ